MKDTAYHFLRCQGLRNSPRGLKVFQILKADCSKIGVSPLLWDIFIQASTNEEVRVPTGTSRKHHMMLSMLIHNQKDIGWHNFSFGRICYDWPIVQQMVTTEVPRKCDTALHLFWNCLFRYYCQILERPMFLCVYVAKRGRKIVT